MALGRVPRSEGGAVRWRTDIGGSLFYRPVMGAGKLVYAGVAHGDICWMNEADGKVVRRVHAKCWTPIIPYRSLLYVGTHEGTVTAYDAQDGRQRWSTGFQNAVRNLMIGPDGELYVAADGFIWVLDPMTGAVKTHSTGQSRFGSLAVGPNETIIAGGVHVAALHPGDLRPVWESAVEGEVNASAVGQDGTIYVSYQYEVVAVDGRTGKPRWKFDSQKAGYWEVAAGADSHVYLASEAGEVYALDERQGAVVWARQFGARVPRPAIGQGDSLYISTDGNTVYALRKRDGGTEWYCRLSRRMVPYAISSSPALGPNGRMYVGGSDNCVYCLGSRPS